ncbi:MAG: 50S ribosomal protein L3 N(5)-glutamine methyltransferase [Usitatibacter sp.]
MARRLVEDIVAESAARLDEARVAFGHGTVDALQEARWLATHVLGMSWRELERGMKSPVSAAQGNALADLVARRIATRKPAAYLLHEAWLGQHRFYVDERVIVPRSFIFELLEKNGVRPLFRERSPATVLDLCTGSGCLAILAALAFPEARVDAADLSRDALAVAARNVADYKLRERVRLVESDLFSALGGRRYDLIISNPPYVKAASMRRLPLEYRREPEMALASGADGLDHTRIILAQARRHLNPGGLLVVEIGHNRKALEKSYPGLDFSWPKTSAGRGFVFTLRREALE